MSIDLSLIRVFCVIYEAGSVSRAAELLALTQPAVSHSLNLLRQQLGDALFVRGRSGVTPTQTADALYNTFRHSLEAIDRACTEVANFTPETSDRLFRVAMSDIGELVYLPPLLGVLRHLAPTVAIEVVPIALNEVARALTTGRIDLAIGYLPDLAAQTVSASIFMEHHVCLFRKGHPLIGTHLSLEIFQQCSHVVVSSPFSRLNIFTEFWTGELRRKAAIQVIHFTSVPMLIAQTDLLLTLPSRVARIFSRTHKLKSLPVPLAIPSFEVRLHWHIRASEDRGHRWMRELMIRIFSAL